jgi:hypothetical protein
MTTVTGLTAARMLDIEQNSVVDGSVVGDNLILEKQHGQTIDAGNVRGPAGPEGPAAADPLDAFDDYALALASCVSWYKFREAPVLLHGLPNAIRDSKGTRHGQLSTQVAGQIPWTYPGLSKGARHGGLVVNGPLPGVAGTTSEFVDFGDTAMFQARAAFSVLVLLRRPYGSTHASGRRIAGKTTLSATDSEWDLHVDSVTDKVFFRRWDAAGGDLITDSAVLPYGVDTLVTGTYDGTDMCLYVDSVLKAGPTPSTRNIPDRTPGIRLGNVGTNQTAWLGEISRFGLFNAALLLADVQELSDLKA